MAIMEALTMLCGVLFYTLLIIQHTGADCEFPSEIQNSNWTSSNFGSMVFNTTAVAFTDIIGSLTVNSWTCSLTDNSSYVLRSTETTISFSETANAYYCFVLTKQNTYSYSYYLNTAKDTNNKRTTLLPQSTTITLDLVCNSASDPLDTAEFHVMINSASVNLAAQYCATPLFGTFNYTYTTDAGVDKCGTSPGTGVLDVCDTADRNKLTFSYGLCSELVAYSTLGVVNCVATVSKTSGSTTTYYQTLYNTDTTLTASVNYQFTCFTVTSVTATSGTETVYVSQIHTTCAIGQTSTTAPSNGATLVLSPYVTCPLTSVITDDADDYVVLIVCVVLGVLLLLVIVAGLVFYFCYWTKRDPNAGKPIVENTKPRFEDPDKEEILEDLEIEDTRSTVITRDDIAFEAGSPSFLPNGKPMSILNGNPVIMSPNGSTYRGDYKNFNGTVANGSMRRDSGITMTEISSNRPLPRAGLNTNKESMVIFNGDEKVISGNDSRIVPNENPNTQTLTMNNLNTSGGPLSLLGLEFNETDDELGELSPHYRENAPYPSLPREKSNLMPPIETADPEKDKHVSSNH